VESVSHLEEVVVWRTGDKKSLDELLTACLPASKNAFPKILLPVMRIWTRAFGED